MGWMKVESEIVPSPVSDEPHGQAFRLSLDLRVIEVPFKDRTKGSAH